jgi:hypothetical protein
MVDLIFLYLGAVLPAFWGIAHLFATKSVVEGFGDISIDNKHIITMEWIVEGVSLLFMGLLVATVTFIGPLSIVSRAVYILSVLGLLVLAMVSLFTGFKVNFMPYKLCPLIFTISAVLIFIGGVV